MIFNDIINNFRKDNGVGEVEFDHHVVSGYCKEHCWAMAIRGQIYNAEPCYLRDWSEAVCVLPFDKEFHDIVRHAVYDVFGTNHLQREILLKSSVISYGAISFLGNVFVTVRGK